MDRQLVSPNRRRISNRTPCSICGGGAGDRYCRLVVASGGSCPGISVVPGAGRLSLLFLQDAGAMSVDRLRHRRLRPQSASAFSDQTARFLTGRELCPELGISENTSKHPDAGSVFERSEIRAFRTRRDLRSWIRGRTAISRDRVHSFHVFVSFWSSRSKRLARRSRSPTPRVTDVTEAVTETLSTAPTGLGQRHHFQIRRRLL